MSTTTSTYHLMRNFIALLRTLGYSRFVSLENFRKPNFPLMADMLCYLLKRFDSSVEINTKIDTEQERLAFVRTTSQLMVSKAHLDINTKKLYMADVNSVPEMLKLAKLIYDAWKALKASQANVVQGDADAVDDNSGDNSDNGDSTATFDKNQYNNFKTNQLCSEILQLGTSLYDILAEEDNNRAQRQQVLARQIVIEQIESNIRQSIQQLQEEMTSMQDHKETLDQDNEDLNSKIEKKFAELERNRKRLQTLTSQRPVFMDELEKVEQDIIRLYDDYVVNSRCLFFLEQKLEEFEEAEKIKIDERNEEIKLMLEQMRVDEFLKVGKSSKNGSQNGLDELADDEVDIPSDDGEGSDISDAMARDLEISNKKVTQPQQQPQQKKLVNDRRIAAEKKNRSLLANTVVVKREPRSSKTARIYSYGSLLAGDDDDDEISKQIPEDDDEDDDEVDDDISKSEALVKMNGGAALTNGTTQQSDSEIDLDAIDSDVDSDNGSSIANLNLSDDFVVPPGPNTTSVGGRSKPPIPNNAKLTTKFSFDKSDDNF